jgi:hypothetical protein
VCKITETTKSGNVISEVYCNQWLVGNMEMLNISSTEGTCYPAVMHCST